MHIFFSEAGIIAFIYKSGDPSDIKQIKVSVFYFGNEAFYVDKRTDTTAQQDSQSENIINYVVVGQDRKGQKIRQQS